MLGSNILDVAIGLIFVFLLMSLICSAANELLEGVLKKRARDLEEGIKELVGDPKNQTGLVKEIYNHGLVNGLFRGDYSTTEKGRLPSYIPARNFALALLEVRANWETIAKISAAEGIVADLPKNVVTAFQAFETIADGDPQKLQASVEDWYNGAMDRVSGWYKRRAQFIILTFGLISAIAVNADCIAIAKRLSNDSSLRQGVVALAEAAGKKDRTADDKTAPIELIEENLKTLDSIGLPIGWPPRKKGDTEGWESRLGHAVEDHFLGWVLTALAVSLGAPFWFDMLNKIIVVRSTVKPHEKSREEGSKDGEGQQKATKT